LMPTFQRSTRRAVPRRTNRKLYSLATTHRAGVAWPDLTGAWNVQQVKIIAAALAFVILVGLFEFFNGDSFYVYTFEVNGTKYLTRAEVERTSGLIGYNIFFVDARTIEQSLLKLPEVKSVRVSTGLPNQVAVQVEERAPEIVWQRGAESYWLDHDGIAFRARANLTQLPAIRDLDLGAVKLGQPIQSDGYDAYHALHAAWSTAPSVFEWSSARGLSYIDEHGWKIYLGDSTEMAGKLAKLGALMPQLASQNVHIAFIDLSKGDPFYQ
ncbi:MAG TPA: FtsQ-type POTRA domain-containing protein, partial [Anaerolineae bacterium]